MSRSPTPDAPRRFYGTDGSAPDEFFRYEIDDLHFVTPGSRRSMRRWRFALRRQEITRVCTAGDVRLGPMQIGALERAASIPIDEARRHPRARARPRTTVRAARGAVVPEWLEPLLDR